MAGRNLVRLDVDVSRAGKKLFKLEKKIEQGTRLTVQEVGELGKNKARALAPYWSGETFRNIILRKGKENEAVIVAQNPTASRKTSNFNLVRWMHQSPRAARHIKSGDRKFMFTTRDYLKKVVPEKIRARYNKIVLETNNT